MTSHVFKTRHGLSLVEVVVSTAIVGGMVVASLDTVGAVYRNRRLVASQHVAHGLAHELMSEVVSMPYEDPEEPGGAIGTDTSESGGQRDLFDDLDDYDGWSGQPPRLRDGTVLGDYGGWHREVDVNWARRTDGTIWWLYDTGLKRIKVTVTRPDGVKTVLRALRSRDGMLEQAPAVDLTAIHWIGAELQLGNSPIVARHGTQLTNHATDAAGATIP